MRMMHTYHWMKTVTLHRQSEKSFRMCKAFILRRSISGSIHLAVWQVR